MTSSTHRLLRGRGHFISAMMCALDLCFSFRATLIASARGR
jgi:hypothetical protein